jgi:hypothetical protein
MEGLKHEPNASPPQSGAFCVAQLGGVYAIQEIAAAGWMIQAAEDVKQG